MASLTKDGRLQFMCDDGKRKTVRLGKIPKKQAQGIQRHVERLVACQIDGCAPPEETSRWVVSISDKLRDRLAKAGLLQRRESSRGYTLGRLVDNYKSRPKWLTNKPNTRKNNSRAFDHMLEYFGTDKLIGLITIGDAENFYGNLQLDKKQGGCGLAVGSCNQVASNGFTLLSYAVDSELLNRNPFKKLPRTPRKGNNSFVSEKISLQVLNAITNSEQRLLFGLSRWGGLRIPSEPKLLRWCDVDWENQRFLVHSPKTERHEGRETRWVPIFPELAPLFDARFTEAREGDDYVLPTIHRLASPHSGHFLKNTLRRAGIEKWPRLWHSMRSTRQTELVERFPVHVVCAWLGNTIDVAAAHYLQTTEAHFVAATKVAQKAAQHAPAPSGLEQQLANSGERKN